MTVQAKKRVLIAGGSHSEIPLIRAARALGFHTISSGNRATDIGHAYADETKLVDYSDRRAVARLAAELNVQAICPGCNDFAALSASHAASELGLCGHDPIAVAEIIHHKDRFRNFSRQHGLPSPHAEGFDAPRDARAALPGFRLPVIIKPIDMSGGKGISVAANADTYAVAINIAFKESRAKRIVVEEYVEGTRHGMSAFLRDGQVVFSFVDDEHYFLNPYLVAATSAPGTVPSSAIRRLHVVSEAIARSLSLTTGIFHIQFILRELEPVIVEICRRPPGDMYIEWVKHATGVDYPAYLIRAFAGMDCGDLVATPPTGFSARHCIMARRAGIVRDVVIDQSVRPNIIDQLMWWKPGQAIENAMTQKFGIVFLSFGSAEEMRSKMAKMNDLIRVDVDDVPA